MQKNRRKFLLSGAVALTTASTYGYKDMLGSAITLKDNGEKAKDSIYGDSHEVEFLLKDGFKVNGKFKVLPSVCNGCTTHCGVRVKIDEDNNIARVFGNPYSLLSSNPWLDFNTPLKDSFLPSVSSSMCARGNIIFDKLNDTARVTKPLKRVGKRGENKWKEITPRELIDEIVNGGNLFGEGYVKGLKEIRDLSTLIDKENPEFGAMVNKLCIFGTADEGRQKYIQQRFMQSFGTVNFMGHTAICGLSMRAGEACYLNDFNSYPHLKPDFENCKFLLNIATAPAQAGNPFKRQAKLLAHARSENNCKYVTVTPNLTNADAYAVPNSKWLPIKPGTDLALVMAMLRVIIEEKRYLKQYLQIPSQKAQNELNEASHTNATHLIVVKDGKNGEFLRDENGDFMVLIDGELSSSKDVLQADLEVDKQIIYKGKMLHVKSSFSVLKENAYEFSLEEYSKICEICKEDIINLAREFTSYGRSVGVDCHGGTMHTTGFYTTYAIMMLGAMVGNLNYKGGMSFGGGRFSDFNGEKYNLFAYDKKIKPKGVRLDKAKFAYEQTSEYRRKIENNQNPYPAKSMWYPLSNAIDCDVLSNSTNAYPYKMDCLISWCANLVYGQSGSEHIKEILSDPTKATPLFIAIDPFINETSMYADYIVPDSVMYETWGIVAPWAASQTKANHLRFPILPSPNAKFENGEPICMDSFVIEVGKALNLGGFGKNGIKDKDDNGYFFDKPSDFYLRAFENIALADGGVKDISDDEFKLSGLEEMYKRRLVEISPKNWRKIAYVMVRGGRFDEYKNSYNGKFLKRKYQKTIALYNEDLAKFKHALTAEGFSGSPKYYKPRFSDATELNLDDELLAFSYKSNVFSSPTAASDSLKRVKYTTYIELNPTTAKKLDIKNGDYVKVSSQDGFIKGYVKLRHGIHPKSVGVEHGAGRDGEGATDFYINNKLIKAKVARKSGISINKLGLKDNAKSKHSTLCDFIVGSNARQAIPVKVIKI
ncbi:molybdopterin-dependent oxidoreductase [Campylobacter geochelonis]|uniref:molybdopterin-dependent oxidoreductase n=1 Tax=Campylobacter geochelonis TaxID=1780362 RepID=UPI000770A215|nr:molybdopterin-dependent oxidoreductase [Campylobacter geochelonis]CZE48296.1 orotate phosphoribosyltransferase (oprt%3B oprtase) [Campylobacter geochelonis]